MSSKAVQYLTLPIPRVAITSTARHDALADYLADKPGWLCSQVDSPALAEQLRDHLPPLERCQARPATQRHGLAWPMRSPRS
jgi:hypothetical protein